MKTTKTTNATNATNEGRIEAMTERTLNRSAARRAAAAALRNAVIDAAPLYVAALLHNDDTAYTAAIPAVDAAAAAYAAALACTKDGEKLEYIAVPAALLIPAAVTLAVKGSKEAKHFRWDVRGLAFFKNTFTVDAVERSEKCKESVFTAAEKDYLQPKKPAAQKPAWNVVYAGYDTEKKIAYQQYKAEKAIAKIKHEQTAPIDKKFTFPTFEEWFAVRPAA